MSTDKVALEVTGCAWEVARIVEPFVQNVIVVSPDDTGIAQARAKDRPVVASARKLAALPSNQEIQARPLTLYRSVACWWTGAALAGRPGRPPVWWAGAQPGGVAIPRRYA